MHLVNVAFGVCVLAGLWLLMTLAASALGGLLRGRRR